MTRGSPVILIVAMLAAGCQGPPQPLRLAGVFSDNMVLQRDMPAKIWGWAHPGAPVEVVLGSARAQAKADAQGRWAVSVPPMVAGGPLRMVVSDDRGNVAVNNILIGEVWLFGGQSNMNWPLRGIEGGPQQIAQAGNYPDVRLSAIRGRPSATPVDDVKVDWFVATPKRVERYAAVAYLFARRLNRELKVPVGMLRCAHGATPILPWIPPEQVAELRKLPALRDLPQPGASLPAKKLRIAPGVLYNGIVHPIAGFAVRGMIWYQGEAETYVDDGMLYADKQAAMVAGWRKAWGAGQWPFYYVHLPPFDYVSLKKWFPKVTRTSLLTKWEAQVKCLRTIPNSDMIVITDLGNPKDIHPRNKIPVAGRLADMALAKTYGREGLTVHGPVFKSMTVDGARAVVRFDHVGSGLAARDGKALTWFEIAGADRIFHAAEATVVDNTVVVGSPEVPAPVAVRYNWRDSAIGNLCNREGLPARPFRTDSW